MSFFVSGLWSLSAFRGNATWWSMLRKHLLLLCIPWAMLTLSLLWRANCSYWQGLTFYLIFTLGSVCLGVSLAFLIYRLPFRLKRTTLLTAGIAIAILGVVYDIGFHPQFFTYNHVFGGVMGPLYDEELRVRGGLVAFRFLTLMWALWCVSVAHLIRPTSRKRVWMLGVAISSVSILLIYLNSADLRINTSPAYVKSYLQGHAPTEHFDVYYDPAAIDSSQLRQILNEHEYRYEFLREQLLVDVESRIQSFIYPDPETKDHLTGARYTSVAPVWLKEPQTHILLDHFDGVFAHELGHVFSREFGMPILNASFSVGLVEGVAVAFEPADGRPHPHEQVLAASAALTSADSLVRIGPAFDLKARLSPLGFWTGRGAVSYTTMGSFVRFLVDAYGVDRLKQVYAFGDFETVYGKSVDDLVNEWERTLLGRPFISRSANSYVTSRFSTPSLFEKDCPHHIPPFQRQYERGIQLLVDGDTTGALASFEDALNEEPLFQEGLDGWTQLMLSKWEVDETVSRLIIALAEIDSVATPYAAPALWFRLGDAYAMAEQPIEAVNAYEKARSQLSLYAQEQHGLVILRQELASLPAAIGTIYKNMDVETRLHRLAELHEKHPLVAFQQAYLLLQENRFAEALEKLERLDLNALDLEPTHLEFLCRLRLIVLTELYELNLEPEKALYSAEELIRTFKNSGAFQEAAFYADIAGRMRYIMSHGS